MNCPKCEEEDLYRDSADVGVGIMYGPYGCHRCGWSEWTTYDLSEGPKTDPSGYTVDQWGGLMPPGGHW